MPLEAKMLTKTVENAQKKVEEQNFLIRKRVLEYDDVMNEQRRVVYKYRREILEGRDMSEIARDELEGVIERLVDEYTPGDVLEDWDMPELETQLRQIWPVGIDVAALAPETVDREKLKDELDDDAMNAYDEREEQLGEELMRYLERSILLQVIDNRWREHLYDMDYLREGIHLRGFAQIDPLVAYKNEGFAMFEELMHSIWEEFSKLIFHVEVEIDPAQAEQAFAPNGGSEPAALDYSGGTLEAQPSALQQVAAAAGAGRASERRRGSGRAAARGNGGTDVVETVVKDEHDEDRPQRPLLVRLGQEVQEVPRRLSARFDRPGPRVHPRLQRAGPGRVRRGARPRGRAALRRGLRKGREAARTVGDARRRAACSRRSSSRSSTRTTEPGGRAVALIRRRWHWDEDGSPAGEDEMAWVFELRDGRIAAGVPSRTAPRRWRRRPALRATDWRLSGQ